MQGVFSIIFVFSLLAGALWGLANAWCMARLVQCAIEGKRGWKLAGWVAAKLIGLYGLVAWMLVGLRLPAAAWMAGFTLSLVALAVIARNEMTKQSPARND